MNIMNVHNIMNLIGIILFVHPDILEFLLLFIKHPVSPIIKVSNRSYITCTRICIEHISHVHIYA